MRRPWHQKLAAACATVRSHGRCKGWSFAAIVMLAREPRLRLLRATDPAFATAEEVEAAKFLLAELDRASCFGRIVGHYAGLVGSGEAHDCARCADVVGGGAGEPRRSELAA